MSNATEKYEYYRLSGQYYLNDGVYCWEEIDAYCQTLEAALDCMLHHQQDSPQYVDYRVVHHITEEVIPPTMGFESDWGRFSDE